MISRDHSELIAREQRNRNSQADVPVRGVANAQARGQEKRSLEVHGAEQKRKRQPHQDRQR